MCDSGRFCYTLLYTARLTGGDITESPRKEVVPMAMNPPFKAQQKLEDDIRNAKDLVVSLEKSIKDYQAEAEEVGRLRSAYNAANIASPYKGQFKDDVESCDARLQEIAKLIAKAHADRDQAQIKVGALEFVLDALKNQRQ